MESAVDVLEREGIKALVDGVTSLVTAQIIRRKDRLTSVDVSKCMEKLEKILRKIISDIVREARNI